MESEPIQLDDTARTVTASIGAGVFDPRLHDSAGAFHRDVDTAMYRAKMNGRNQGQRVAASVHAEKDATRATSLTQVA